MPFPPFLPRHSGDNATSSHTLQKDGVCIFTIYPYKLNILQEIGVPLIFDIEIEREGGKIQRCVYYAQPDDLALALKYYKLTSRQDPNTYTLAVTPDDGHVHGHAYSRCEQPKEKSLFSLIPMSPELYEQQYIRIDDTPENRGDLNMKQALEHVRASIPNLKEELWRVLSTDSNTPELKLLPHLRLLAEAGSDINGYFGSEHTTPLHEAAWEDRPLVLQWLLENGAYTEAVDEHGRTPLAYAVYRAQTENVSCLLNGGANADARDDANNYIMQYSISPNYHSLEVQRAIVNKLMEHDTSIASAKCDILSTLRTYCTTAEHMPLLAAYCLPLHDMLCIYKKLRRMHPECVRAFQEIMSRNWNQTRAALYRRMWRKGERDVLSTMLIGDAVELKNGEIYPCRDSIRKFNLEGKNIRACLLQDIAQQKAIPDMRNVFDLYPFY